MTGVGGINQQSDLADPVRELAEATNVWAPNGKLVSRPSYAGVLPVYVDSSTTDVEVIIVKEDPIGTFSQTGILNSLGIGERFYVGIDSTPTMCGMELSVDAANSNSTRWKFEVWLAATEEWSYIPTFTRSSAYLADSVSTIYYFVLPRTIRATATPTPTLGAVSTVGKDTWFRVTLLDAAFDADTSLGGPNPTIYESENSVTVMEDFNLTQIVTGFFNPQYSSGSEVIFTLNNNGGPNNKFITMGALTLEGYAATTGESFVVAEAPTMAVVPQFDECFIATGGQVRHKKLGQTIAVAAVENNPAFVGNGEIYGSDYVNKLGAFPSASYVLFHKGRLWAAGIQGEPFTVRWSEPAPYHKVWAGVAFEYLMEDDNSSITGLAALGEHVVVFKRDSIWVMVDSGIDPETGLGMFTPVKVVSGVGCTAQSSIQQVRGTLIFLAEDGVYAFDGTAAIQKLSDRVTDLLSQRSTGLDRFVASLNWKTESCYLLSIPTPETSGLYNGAVNALTLVFDYKNNSWWVWKGFSVTAWCITEDDSDLAQPYFTDILGWVQRLSISPTYETDPSQESTTNAAIEYIKTQRLGQNQTTLRFRSVNVTSTNRSNSLTTALTVEDNVTGSTAALDFTDTAEANWDDFSYAAGATTDDNWTPTKRRSKRVMMRLDGDFATIEITHDQPGIPLELAGITIGYMPLGAR